MPSQASLTLLLAFVQAVPMATMLSLAALAGLQKYSIWLLASLHVPTRVFFESSAAKDSEVSIRGRASKKPSRIIFTPPKFKNKQLVKSCVRRQFGSGLGERPAAFNAGVRSLNLGSINAVCCGASTLV